MIVTKALISLATVLAVGYASAAIACEAAGPEAFLRRVYAPYIAGDSATDPTGRAAPTIFDTRLTTLIRKDQAQPEGEIGVLDADPICNCQDFDRIKLLSIKVMHCVGNSATANVQFTNLNKTAALKYKLINSRRGWRITDIATKDTPSLVAFLQAGIKPR